MGSSVSAYYDDEQEATWAIKKFGLKWSDFQEQDPYDDGVKLVISLSHKDVKLSREEALALVQARYAGIIKSRELEQEKAERAKLKELLDKYGLPEDYLKYPPRGGKSSKGG